MKTDPMYSSITTKLQIHTGSRQEPCSRLSPPLAQLSLCTELPLLCWLRWRHIMYVCVLCVLCVCVFSSHSLWTPSSLDVPARVTQEEDHTGFLIHLPSAMHAFIFLARRIQPFLSLVDREVEFCVIIQNSDLVVLHFLGILFFIFYFIPYFLVRKNQSYWDLN